MIGLLDHENLRKHQNLSYKTVTSKIMVTMSILPIRAGRLVSLLDLHDQKCN